MESVLHVLLDVLQAQDIHLSNRSILLETIIWLVQYFLLVGRLRDMRDLVHRIFQWGDYILLDDSDASNTLRSKCGIMEIALGHFSQAQAIVYGVLRSQILSIGEHHADTLHSLNNLGVAYQTQHLYEKAEKYHLKALSNQGRAIW